ncbi:YchJ family protein [Vibrio sp. LaRot3]|uniref:YchJ family protein n=1 Tax=Vibrio sp. LaRot3 TaxID=2998829 RepID=UPI0022CE2C66|nr:YchJ family protein [Vibrio sp. LaRot3]MDA0147168.1 YchJ family protein [Vibrio sp. LaRot3]
MNSCPCGAANHYEDCCYPIHQDHSQAHTPEQLMRSRYSAHVKGLVDYVINTYHPSCQAEEQRDAIAESIASDWAKLEVISAEPSSHEDEGFVTFKAYFNQEGKQYCLEERSRFVRENELWYYIDGEFPEPEQDPRLNQPVQSLKVSRNDPCICGSGRKFKKCCG